MLEKFKAGLPSKLKLCMDFFFNRKSQFIIKIMQEQMNEEAVAYEIIKKPCNLLEKRK